MAKKHKHPEHVNLERWLVSYADFITLLFAFFTALYAISTVDAKKASKMQFSTRSAFNLDLFPQNKPPASKPSVESQIDATSLAVNLRDKPIKRQMTGMFSSESVQTPQSLQHVYNELRKLVDEDRAQGVSVRASKNAIILSLHDAAYFAPGSIELRKAALPMLDKIAERVLATHMDIRVEGHTDDSVVSNPKYHSNWELSTGRAVSVVRYFMQQFAYPPDMISVAGYGSYKPLASNDTPEGRASNRRVDIILLAPRQPVAEFSIGPSTTEDSPPPSGKLESPPPPRP